MESQNLRGRQGGCYLMGCVCKECNKEFDSISALHKHLKADNITVAEYYVKHFQRKNKLTGSLLPFKNVDQYFREDFATPTQFLKWCEKGGDEVESYLINVTKKYLDRKERQYAPVHFELKDRCLPTIDLAKDVFGSYSSFCKKLGAKQIFSEPLIKEFYEDLPPLPLAVDTREQKPLFEKNPNAKRMKLDFGDYTLLGENFSNVFVDRKSSNDFIGTFSKGKDRFRREMQRCMDLGSYMFVVVEAPFKSVKSASRLLSARRSAANFDWVVSNAAELQHEFGNHLQIIFSQGRGHSEEIIPRLLFFGRKLTNTDMSYFIEKEYE
jgi:hypothetical protein